MNSSRITYTKNQDMEVINNQLDTLEDNLNYAFLGLEYYLCPDKILELISKETLKITYPVDGSTIYVPSSPFTIEFKTNNNDIKYYQLSQNTNFTTLINNLNFIGNVGSISLTNPGPYYFRVSSDMINYSDLVQFNVIVGEFDKINFVDNVAIKTTSIDNNPYLSITVTPVQIPQDGSVNITSTEINLSYDPTFNSVVLDRNNSSGDIFNYTVSNTYSGVIYARARCYVNGIWSLWSTDSYKIQL